MIDDECLKLEYYSYFNQELLPIIKILDDGRKKTLIKVIFISLIYCFAGVLSAYLFIDIILNDIFNPILFPVILFFMYFCFIKSIINIIWENKKFQKKIMKELYPLFLVPVANFKNWQLNSNTSDIIDSE